MIAAWVSTPVGVFISDFSNALETPVTSLIDWISENHPTTARTWLRFPIETNYELTPLCGAMIKLFAKRSRRSDLPQDSANSPLRRITEHDLPPLLNHNVSPLSSQLTQDEVKTKRQIQAAIVCVTTSETLSTNQNDNRLNKTRHAEWLLLKHWVRSQPRTNLPVEIQCTLQPCLLCGEAAKKLGIAIRYLYSEPGPRAHPTWGIPI